MEAAISGSAANTGATLSHVPPAEPPAEPRRYTGHLAADPAAVAQMGSQSAVRGCELGDWRDAAGWGLR